MFETTFLLKTRVVPLPFLPAGARARGLGMSTAVLCFITILFPCLATVDLDAFFATTYIEKVKGTWDTSNNLYLFSCYKDGWSLFHLHHVCVRGGQDGVVTGLNSVENDWSLYSQGENNFKISAKDWDNTQGVAMGHALKSVRIDESDVARTILIKDGTIFANCYQQSSNTANPAHWMMKLGTLYEIAHCKAKDSSKSMFRNNWPVPMKQLYLHQCANPSETNWKWGQNMYGLVSNQMVESGLLDLKFIFYNDDGYEPRSVKGFPVNLLVKFHPFCLLECTFHSHSFFARYL